MDADRLKMIRMTVAGFRPMSLGASLMHDYAKELLSLLDAPPIVDAEQVAEMFKDLAMFPEDRELLSSRIAAALTAQRVAERQRIREAVEAMSDVEHGDALLSMRDVLKAIDGGEADGA